MVRGPNFMNPIQHMPEVILVWPYETAFIYSVIFSKLCQKWFVRASFYIGVKVALDI